MKMKLMIIILLLISSFFGYLSYNHIPAYGMLKFPKILFALRAKEFCSCYFVEERGEDFCREAVKMGFPIVRLKYNAVEGHVESGVIFKRHAQYISSKLGCKLFPL